MKPRKRKVTANTEQSNGKDKADARAPSPASSSNKSSRGIMVALLVMVAITWGVAATAYFGVVDYKSLVGIDVSAKLEQRSNDVKKDNVHVKEEPTPKKVASPNEAKLEKASNADEADATKKVKSSSKVEQKKDAEAVKPQEAKPKNSQKKETSKKASKPKLDPYTSTEDKPILKKLKKGDQLLKENKFSEALKLFEKLTTSYPTSARAMFGKAEALFQKAEAERSNQILQESIKSYGKVADISGCTDALKKKALLVKIDKQHFLGQTGQALRTALNLYQLFPKDVEVLNRLGVCYLWMGKNDKAEKVYAQALTIDPNDGFALVHYGFILKTNGDWVKGAKYLKAGIDSKAEGTQDGKFYMHLGDALHRTNRTAEAEEIYQLGADKGLFKSKYQRSLYNVDRLVSRPFWTAQQARVTNYVKTLEKNWKIIRDEALRMMDVESGLFLPEEESLKNTGDWKQLTLYARGRQDKDCKRFPKTCALVEKMPNANGCTRGQIKFSVMSPGTHVWAHTGPTNCRLRMHLGLVIPQTGDGVKIRCADKYRTWEEGKVLIFDDSFEHEVWQNAKSFRLILIIDVWHPDLTESEKRTLSPI